MPVAGAWVIAVSVADRLVLGFPEDALRSTGMVLVDSDRVPREHVPELAWRDDLLLSLHTDTQREAEAERIAETVEERLSDLHDVARVQTQVEADGDWPVTISVWLNAQGDCLQLAASVMALTDRGWDLEADEDPLLSAIWVSDGADFLAPEVRAAELVYRRWSAPERRSWSELPVDLDEAA